MVLHKNKWDKKASRNHEKKLAQKDSKAAAEEKEKTLARTAARANSRTIQVASATSAAAPATASGSLKSPAVGGNAGGKTASATAGEGVAATGEVEDNSQTDSDSELGEGQDASRYSRRKKAASNAWRYEEPEPEPGEEPEDVEPEPDYASLTREKLKSIEEREQEREEIIDIRDRDSGLRKFGQSNDMDFGPKGNVVKVNRDEFKDVTEKMAKQATADRFRQRFASRKTSARSKEENVEFDDHESELDALIGNMDIKGKRLGPPAMAPHSSKNTATPLTETKVNSATKTKNTQQLDDDWLDDMLR